MKQKAIFTRVLGIATLIALGASATTRAGTVTVDATSGSSIKVSSATCTSTGATVAWTYSKSNGTWKLYYGTTNVAAPTTTGWASTASPSSKTATISGLTAGTKYYALLAGWEGGVSSRAQSYAHLSFTTDGKADGIRHETPYGAAQPSTGYDAFGRRLGRVLPAGVMFGENGASRFVPER